MKKTIMFVVTESFADWEGAFLTTALMGSILDKTTEYTVKTVGVTTAPVRSIGGFTVVPDYGIDSCPNDFAGLFLIGGNAWRTDDAKKLAPLVKQAFAEGKVIGAICDATVFLGMNGLLNDRAHTSNNIEGLVEGAGEAYTGNALYKNEQCVRDGNLITANGTGYLEFTREALSALKAYPDEYIAKNYDFFKDGYIEMMKKMAGA